MFSLLSRVQSLPAAKEGDWAYAGAFGDLTIRFVAYAVRLAKGRTLPPGIPPEEQAAQGLLWNAVVFWSALFYHLPLLCEWEGELDGGELWLPGFTVPGKPFRFRYCTERLPQSYVQGRLSLLAGQLLPSSAIPWLLSIPDAFDCLTERMQGRPATVALIDELLLTAAEKCGAPPLIGRSASPVSSVSLIDNAEPQASSPEPLVASALTSALPENSPVAADNGPPPETENESLKQDLPPLTALVSVLDAMAPKTESETSEKNDQHTANSPPVAVQDDTQALLGLFSGMTDIPTPNVESVADTDVTMQDEIKNKEETENDKLVEPKDFVTFHTKSDADRDENNKGAVFLEWLSAGLISGEITINEEGARAHIVAGFVFLCVPEIFYLFQKKTENKGKRNALQASFERLGVHRVADGKRFIQARIYSTPSGTGTYQNINGYLVKASSLYRGNRIPDESALLILP